MDINLTGQTALITGGSKGIGRAVAERFAAEGCDVHLVARTQADLDVTKAVIEQAHGVAVTTHALDLSTSRSVDHLAEVCQQVPILVNNAGAIPAGNVAAVDEARWRAAWDL